MAMVAIEKAGVAAIVALAAGMLAVAVASVMLVVEMEMGCGDCGS